MKGHVINLDGQLVCIFPFTNATSERMAHNDLQSYTLCYEDGLKRLPYLVDTSAAESNFYGWCFSSCPINEIEDTGVGIVIMERDRADIAAIAEENDAWAAEQVKETDAVSPTGYTDDGSIPVGDEQGDVQDDEGAEREFDVDVVEKWTMLVSYKVTATSKQDAKDRITNQEVDFYNKELIEEEYVNWKSIKETE